jgi:hypothetical protein
MTWYLVLLLTFTAGQPVEIRIPTPSKEVCQVQLENGYIRQDPLTVAVSGSCVAVRNA